MADFAGRAQRRSARARRPRALDLQRSAVGRLRLRLQSTIAEVTVDRGARFVTLGVILVAGSSVRVLGGWPGAARQPDLREGEACPPEQHDAAPASSRPCDSTSPSLASSRMVLPRRPRRPSRHPASAAAIAALAAAHRAPGRGGAGRAAGSVGAVAWPDDRPARVERGRRRRVRDPGRRPHGTPAGAGGLGGVQDGGRPGQRDARLRREAAGGGGRAGQDPARPGRAAGCPVPSCWSGSRRRGEAGPASRTGSTGPGRRPAGRRPVQAASPLNQAGQVSAAWWRRRVAFA